MTLRRAWKLGAFGAAWLLCSGWAVAAFQISSPNFAPGQLIPDGCARAHGNVSPELRIREVPPRAKSLVLIVDDPDSPSGLWTHWLIWNIRPGTRLIPGGSPPSGAELGKNSFGAVRYDGPQPPGGVHRYFFHLYALDSVLALAPGSGRDALAVAMQGHVIAKTETMGTYAAGR
jgi:Raf kinase inhibitor-like YbhB/YbcL family protein